MTFAENRTYGVPEFAGTEVNRHSGKLKGLSGGQGKKGLHHNMENTLACEEVKQYMHLQAVSFTFWTKHYKQHETLKTIATNESTLL